MKITAWNLIARACFLQGLVFVIYPIVTFLRAQYRLYFTMDEDHSFAGTEMLGMLFLGIVMLMFSFPYLRLDQFDFVLNWF